MISTKEIINELKKKIIIYLNLFSQNMIIVLILMKLKDLKNSKQ